MTAETKFTIPMPWVRGCLRWSGRGNRLLGHAWLYIGLGECETDVRIDGPDTETVADLIAAAPDLYAALERLLADHPAFRGRFIGEEGSPARLQQRAAMDAEDAARAALAKARGEQP